MSLQKTDTNNYNSELASSSLTLRARLGDYYELTKPRLSFLSVLTAVIGYLVVDPNRDFGILTSLLLGTSLCAGGAATLNQWLERDADARMVRTKDRPIAAGRVTPLHALLYGLALSVAGCNILYFGANPLAGLLSATHCCLVYPNIRHSKKLTTWNTPVGAIHRIPSTSNRLRCCSGSDKYSGLDTFFDSLLLANATLFRHRMDIPTRLSKRRFCNAFKFRLWR